MAKFSESTLIPMSLVVTIVGAVIPMGVLYQKVEAHTIQIDKNSATILRQTQFESEVIDRLARIETLLGEERKHKPRGN